jgi:hypothetical protein
VAIAGGDGLRTCCHGEFEDPVVGRVRMNHGDRLRRRDDARDRPQIGFAVREL